LFRSSILLLSENNRFSKGIFEWVGFNKKVIEFDHIHRTSGHSTFNPLKLADYAIDGISAYNHRPLRICFYLGLMVLIISLAYIAYMLVNIVINGVEVPGYFTIDRKSTRLNSSHVSISYAVFCL